MTKIDFSRMVTAESRAAESLAMARTEAGARLAALLETAAGALSHGASLAERLTWSAKETAAQAVLAGSASPVQAALLEEEAERSGETVKELALAIISHAEAFRAAVTRYVGLRRQATAALAACTTPQELSAVLEDLQAKLKNP